MRVRPLTVVSLVLWLTCTDAQRSSGAQDDGCQSPRRAANLAFTLKDLSGRDVALKAFKGQVLLLNFWATWCGPCKVEIPGLVELSAEYGHRGLIVLGISIDDPPSKLTPFVEQLGMSYPVLLGIDQERLHAAYGPSSGVPRTFVVSRDGTLCRTYVGLTPKGVLERQIRSLL
jgi:thiol-disulfide isomerase/thioredoxin